MRKIKFRKMSSEFDIRLPRNLNALQFQKYMDKFRSLSYVKDITPLDNPPDLLRVKINNNLMDNKEALNNISKIFLRI